MYTNRSNLIIGFHGCDKEVRDTLLNSPNDIQISEKPYDWLGHGIYFWENNDARALKWAKDKEKRGEIKEASVIGAVLSLGNCFDLLDSRFTHMIGQYYNLMEANYEALGKEMPKNRDAKADVYYDKILRELDCSVIEFMHETIEQQIKDDIADNGYSTFKRFDSLRGVFTEGGPAFAGAGIQLKSHIQICIRNTNCIKGFFLPRNEV
ncbi:MAG: hypothetical protein PHR83_10150 [Paludibacter sp.]|nr:hypothetical protein [Paludibacter sp.]